MCPRLRLEPFNRLLASTCVCAVLIGLQETATRTKNNRGACAIFQFLQTQRYANMPGTKKCTRSLHLGQSRQGYLFFNPNRSRCRLGKEQFSQFEDVYLDPYPETGHDPENVPTSLESFPFALKSIKPNQIQPKYQMNQT